MKGKKVTPTYRPARPEDVQRALAKAKGEKFKASDPKPEVKKQEFSELDREEAELMQELEQLEIEQETAEDIPEIIIASNLPKITPESVKKETGGKVGTNQDVNPTLLSKDGVSIEAAAEQILGNFGVENGGPLNLDVQEVRNTIIEIIQEPSLKNYIAAYSENPRIAEIKERLEEIKKGRTEGTQLNLFENEDNPDSRKECE